MKKVPNISAKDLLEVKRKRNMNIKFSHIKRQYNISYHDIKKICILFSDCEFESDIEAELERIRLHNEQCAIIDYRGNYQKYKDYYLDYSKQQYQRRINVLWV